MHETSFSDAFMIPRFTVLGLPLHNYAIGHEIGLWKNRNPLITHTPAGFSELSELAQKASLADAVDICCRRRPFFKTIWAFLASKMNLAAEVAKFHEYRAAGTIDLPTIKQPRTQGVPFHYFGAPDMARLLNYVTANHAHLIQTHFEGSPLNFPVGLAKILYSTHLECEGLVWIKNWQDYDTDRRKEAFDKQHPDAGLAVGEEAIQAVLDRLNKENPDANITVKPSKGKP